MVGYEIQDFLAMMSAEKGASPRTIEAYERDLTQFLAFGNFNDIREITKQRIEDFMMHLNDRSYAQKSIARKLSAVKEFCRFLYSEHILPENPSLNVLTPKQEKPLPKFLSTNEINSLIKAANDKNDYRWRRIAVMIELMYATGLRVSELVALPINAINHKKGIITILGKGSKERIVPIAEHTLQSVRSYLPQRDEFIHIGGRSDWLFPSMRSYDGHLTRDSFYKDIKALAIECGINPVTVSPHVFRHSFASHLLNNNADLRSVQKMLGHENITTTEIYTHLTTQKLQKTVCKQHPLSQYVPDAER